jgi:hypothetical protein
LGKRDNATLVTVSSRRADSHQRLQRSIEALEGHESVSFRSIIFYFNG